MRSRGFTITELLVVVTIVGLLATVAAPSFAPTDQRKLDQAATQIAEAMRFARSEAMRTGEAHGVTISQASQRVRAQRYDTSTDPVDPTDTLYHPVTRQTLDFSLTESTNLGSVRISNALDVFNYGGLGRRRTILFNAQGAPIWITDSGANTYGLSDGTIELSSGNAQRSVQVAPYTGRVSIQ